MIIIRGVREFWERVEQRLRNEERSWAWLARQVGVSTARLHSYRAGVRRNGVPPMELADHISRVLGIEEEQVA